jgi:O-succinylbenzoic acid--CoA ligase
MATFIDWQSGESHLLLNPARRGANGPRLEMLPKLPGHIWLATSGTSANRSDLKLVALSKQAFLASAAAVNAHLQVQREDSWFLALPDFHVGGLSISARAHLSSASVKRWPGVGEKWNVRNFYTDLGDSYSTLVSLVPTQVWDLISLELSAPKFLKAAIVGGATLSHTLYERGRLLGWPLLPTYGFTECCSQVATADPESLTRAEVPRLRILSHVIAKIGADLQLSVKSPSLLTGVATITDQKVQFQDPKENGWFHTQDKVDLSGDALSFLGRSDDCIKINGKIVSQLALQNLLERIMSESGWREEAAIVTLNDPRRGNRVALAMATRDKTLLAAVTEKFNQEVLPHERIRESEMVPSLPRTDLGKVKLGDLAAMLT